MLLLSFALPLADWTELAIPVGMILAMVVLITVIVIVSERNKRKRQAAVRAFCESRGLTFAEKTEGPERFREREIAKRGHTQWADNVISGDTQAVDLWLFDWNTVSGSGKNRTHTRTSVAFIEADDLHLPELTLYREGFWSRIGSLVGFQDIDFDEDPAFSKAYVLKGTREETVRRFMDEELRAFLVQQPTGRRLEGFPRGLVVMRESLVDPAQLDDFFAEAFSYLKAFRAAAERRRERGESEPATESAAVDDDGIDDRLHDGTRGRDSHEAEDDVWGDTGPRL